VAKFLSPINGENFVVSHGTASFLMKVSADALYTIACVCVCVYESPKTTHEIKS
jgi:hypothetical protein